MSLVCISCPAHLHLEICFRAGSDKCASLEAHRDSEGHFDFVWPHALQLLDNAVSRREYFVEGIFYSILCLLNDVSPSSTNRATHIRLVNLDDNTPSLLKRELYQTFHGPSPSLAVF